MRATILTVLLACLGLAPLAAQQCRKGPPPELTTLFPDQVAGLKREFYDTREGCVTNLYKQSEYRVADAPEGAAWAVVSIEPHSDPFLGFSGPALKSHWERANMDVIEVAGWPVMHTLTPVGTEFVTLRGDLRVTVVVKDGTSAAAARALAVKFYETLLPNMLVPCGS